MHKTHDAAEDDSAADGAGAEVAGDDVCAELCSADVVGVDDSVTEIDEDIDCEIIENVGLVGVESEVVKDGYVFVLVAAVDKGDKLEVGVEEPDPMKVEDPVGDVPRKFQKTR